MLTIVLKDLTIQAKHGVREHEKKEAQPFRVSVELTLDSEQAAVSDNLEDTVDYAALRRTIIETVQNTSFDLIERLAREVADRVLAADSRVREVIVSIDKPAVFEDAVPGIRLGVKRTAG